jgi:hypothetical protein
MKEKKSKFIPSFGFSERDPKFSFSFAENLSSTESNISLLQSILFQFIHSFFHWTCEPPIEFTLNELYRPLQSSAFFSTPIDFRNSDSLAHELAQNKDRNPSVQKSFRRRSNTEIFSSRTVIARTNRNRNANPRTKRVERVRFRVTTAALSNSRFDLGFNFGFR